MPARLLRWILSPQGGELMHSIQCLLCLEIILLPAPASGKRIDLAGFMRDHLAEHTKNQEDLQLLHDHMGRVSWILDLLAFDSPDEPDGYRELMGQAIEQALQSHSRIEVIPS